MDQAQAAIAGRLSAIETLVAILLAEFTRTRMETPELAIEHLRTSLWEMRHELPADLSPEAEKAFRDEWNRRIDLLLDDAVQLLGRASPT